MIKGFYELRKHFDDLLTIIDVLLKDSQMPCFVKKQNVLQEIKDRVSLRFNVGSEEGKEDYFELVNRIVQ